MKESFETSDYRLERFYLRSFPVWNKRPVVSIQFCVS